MVALRNESTRMINALKKIVLFLLIVSVTSCGPSPDKQSPFSFEERGEGVGLFENGKAVFFYQKEPKSINGEYICNNYIHPLYALNGDTITEEFPADHPYHRGIFWSWHQLYINNQSIGDGWIMENISQEVVDIRYSTNKNSATLNLNVLWKSALFENGKAFINESTTIVVHQLKTGIRRIDLEISLKALVPGASIGGSDDEKGYGGIHSRGGSGNTRQTSGHCGFLDGFFRFLRYRGRSEWIGHIMPSGHTQLPCTLDTETKDEYAEYCFPGQRQG